MNQQNPGTVLITGGSRGIGRATAILAARHGWQVAFTWQTNEAAATKTVGIIEAAGGVAVGFRGDVTSEADVQRNFDQTIDRFGALHAVVVNAGIVAPSTTLAEMSVQRMRRVLDTNVFGALLVAREAARRLSKFVEERDASIVICVFASN